ncbi:MAG: ImmA/IrrE family metallo-endopeptidase [Tetrasphaera sp.]|nr:ImmA/IrrE family metallo-endopeptidase [Tetrasphaera sp.]
MRPALPRRHPARRDLTARQQAETAADYFAGCALVPKRELKRAWGLGIQRIDDLAAHFGVSQHAIEVRLDQTGLSREVDPEPEMRTENRWPVRPPDLDTYVAPQRFRFAQHRYPRRSFV